MPIRRRALLVLILLFALALASLAVALMAGSLPVGWRDVLAAVSGRATAGQDGGGGALAVEVIRGLRLPRALG
ncbi:MAG: hypothetical protein CVU17_10360, partial [Betaproteobacteria bacterium HGW-Betaproteobacteria-11]